MKTAKETGPYADITGIFGTLPSQMKPQFAQYGITYNSLCAMWYHLPFAQLIHWSSLRFYTSSSLSLLVKRKTTAPSKWAPPHADSVLALLPRKKTILH
eukprot:5663553-Ditylum_brightwellii.AAC.1